MAGGSLTASGDAPSPAAALGEGADDQVDAMKQLHEWLRAQGADVSRIQVKPSQAGPGAGLGLFATVSASAARAGAPWWSWLWPRRGHPAQREPTTLASFPLAAAITVRTACNDPQLGGQFRWLQMKPVTKNKRLGHTFGKDFSWMLDKQLLDERTAVMVYLLVERLRGDKSRYAPWIHALPRTFDVPITFSEQELSELRGTALHRAAAAVSKRMRETWSRLEGPLRAVTRELGLPAPSWDDWMWAYCVFWSRGQSLPVPESGSASSALVGHSSGGSDKIPIQILEGLVPGLDFCNHRHNPAPQCWWEVVAPERPKPTGDGGDELYISYGDKSNEELLMLYGFALENNPHDHLMLYCPLPPQTEWDDVLHARMELLQAYGMRPQFFLPHPDQVAAASASAAKRGKVRSMTLGQEKGGVEAAGASTGSDAATPPLALPSEVLDTLEVFVLNFQELAVRSKTLHAKMEERRAARAAGAALDAMSQHSPVLDLASLRSRFEQMSSAELRHYLQAMGLRMATLTTFIRLLEIKVNDMEGPEGTGSLEDDEKLLSSMSQPAAAAHGDAAAAALKHQDQQRQCRRRAAIVYRMGQKQLARAWVVRAKGELRNLLALMRDMQAKQDALERIKQ